MELGIELGLVFRGEMGGTEEREETRAALTLLYTTAWQRGRERGVGVATAVRQRQWLGRYSEGEEEFAETPPGPFPLFPEF